MDTDVVRKQVVFDWLENNTTRQIVERFCDDFDFEPPQTQYSLDDIPVRARADDPATSKKAAVQHYPRAGSQRYKALMAIIMSGATGMHYAEVEEYTGINGIWKRLSELRDGGFIKRADWTRRVSKTGADADVYIATDKGIRAFRENEGVHT